MSADPAFIGALVSPEDPTRTNRRPSLATSDRQSPTVIGRYRVIGLLGEGGMGIVYEAEQDHPRRRVALKVLKSGLPNPDLLWRFEHEAEILGRLQHPGIARIYEAGTADSDWGSQPYFAMELIRGAPLLDYIDAHHLNTRQRLELIAKICEAVQYAHQVGIIHRDLKPGNILVEESGQPKVLDFGVARMTDSDVHATRQTDVGQLVGTLAYMSPEQVRGDSRAVDTRSDIYAIGVMLFQALSGRLPYQIGRQLPEALHTIREEDPARLSSVSRAYRGDVETIVGKALEKDRARRYGSAAELGADLQRYLKHEPITARPPSTAYQLRKFARRNRSLVAGVAAVFFVLVAGIAVSTWEATRARQAEASANAVNDFLQNDLLSQASAETQSQRGAKPDPDLKVRTALERAAKRIEGRFKQQPLVEASIRQTIGNAYTSLALYPEAQQQLERTVAIQRRVLGEEHLETLTTMHDLTELYLDQGKYGQAEPLISKVFNLRKRLLGERHPDTLRSMTTLAGLYASQGKYLQAEPMMTRVLELSRSALGEGNPQTLVSMEDLGSLYLEQGRYGQAEPVLTKVLQLRQRVLGEEHPQTLISMNSIAVLYLKEGKYAQAEPLFAQFLRISRRVQGEGHPETLLGMNNLAFVYLKEGKYEQAAPLFVNVLEVARGVMGPEHPSVLTCMNNLAAVYHNQGKYAQAEPMFDRILQLRRRVLGPEHPDTLVTLNYLAEVYEYQGNDAESEELLLKILASRRRIIGEDHPDTLRAMRDLAELYCKQHRYAEAEPLFTEVAEKSPHVLGPDHPDTLAAATFLAELRLEQDDFVEAEPLLRASIAGFERVSPNNWRRYDSMSLLGASLVGQRKYDEAEPLLIAGYAGILERETTIPACYRSKLEQARERILYLYQRWGKPVKHAEWRNRLSTGAASGRKPLVVAREIEIHALARK